VIQSREKPHESCVPFDVDLHPGLADHFLLEV